MYTTNMKQMKMQPTQNIGQDYYDIDRYNDDTSSSLLPESGTNRGANDILEQCRTIGHAIYEFESHIQSFETLQSRVLSDQASVTELDAALSDLLSLHQKIKAQIKEIQRNPESKAPRNLPQVGRLDRLLKSASDKVQILQSDFRAHMREQQARQYRIVNPNATEEEVKNAIEDPNTQIFQQALLNSDRVGQSQIVLNAVRTRHEAIQSIDGTMVELAEVFQDLDNLVKRQEMQVEQVEENGIDMQENIANANEELDTGIKSARAARKKKWICLGIAILLVTAIAVAIAVYVLNRKPSKPQNGIANS